MLNSDMDLDQEKELISRARNDFGAFGELYEEYYDRIFGYVLRRTASVDDARDITAQVFLKALENIGRFRWRSIPFSAWLFRVAGNEIVNNFRHSNLRYRLKQKLVDATDIDDNSLQIERARLEEDLQRHEEFMVIHKSIARLPLRYQEVIVLHFFEGKKLKEVGYLLGKREGTVKTLLRRAIIRLRKLME